MLARTVIITTTPANSNDSLTLGTMYVCALELIELVKRFEVELVICRVEVSRVFAVL